MKVSSPSGATSSSSPYDSQSAYRTCMQIKDTLFSMGCVGAKVGGSFLSFLFQGLFTLAKYFQPPFNAKELTDQKKLKEAFEKSPDQLILFLLKLVEKKPELAKLIVQNLGRDWKDNPDKYLRYEKSKMRNWKQASVLRKMRMDCVGVINDLFKRFVYESADFEIEGKICDGNLTNLESVLMSLKKIEDQTKLVQKNPDLKSFWNAYTNLQTAQAKVQGIGDSLYAFLLQNAPSLKLDEDNQHLDPHGHFSLGILIERMFYCWHPHDLRTTDAFDSSKITNLLQLLSNDRNISSTRLAPLIRQLKSLYDNRSKTKQVEEIVLAFINAIDPVSIKR